MKVEGSKIEEEDSISRRGRVGGTKEGNVAKIIKYTI